MNQFKGMDYFNVIDKEQWGAMTNNSRDVINISVIEEDQGRSPE